MARYINKKQAVEIFKSDIMPIVRAEYEQDGIPDYIARRERWNDWTDSLCKSRQITLEQYETWSQPRICGD